jgi:hypothetical protein
MTTPSQGLAVIDGVLCLLGALGDRAVAHAPLATAVVEFRRGPFCTYVREHPFGLLPGVPNLYCLDGARRLKWMAEWPEPNDPCAMIVDERDGQLEVLAASGAVVRLDAASGRLIRWERGVAAAG